MTLMLMVACDPSESDTAVAGVISMLEDVKLDAPGEGEERANTGSAEGDEYDTGYLRGWIKATVEEVFAALSSPDVGVDRREMDSWTATELDAPDVDAAYLVNNVPSAAPSEDFDLEWRHEYTEVDGAVVGSRSAWEKTAGTIFVPLLEGSAEAVVSGDAVDLRVVYHLGTIDSTPEDAVRYLEDFYASVVAAAHGDDLPLYE